MPSASETAPIWIFSQSSSVLGSLSTSPFFVITVLTALKMLSANGSIMYFISSLTDTTGLNSPQRTGAGGGAAAGFGDEQPAATAPRTISPAHAISGLRLRRATPAAI